MRQHPSINSPTELDDLQFLADANGITLDEAIARYAWRYDFSRMVTAIEDDDPDSVAGAACASGSTATIRFSGLISTDAQRTIDDFETENQHVTISKQTNLYTTSGNPRRP